MLIQLEEKIFIKFKQQFDTMIENQHIKNHDMWWLFSQLLEGYVMDLDEQFEIEVHDECYKFIQRESKKEDFFSRKNWDLYDDIGHKYFIGYRKIFEFKSHYFQLRIFFHTYYETIHFISCLLGYADESISLTNLLPDNRLKIPKSLCVEET